MKKNVKKILIAILAFILVPLNINAVEITNAEISGTNEKGIGEEVILDFKIDIPGLPKNDNPNTGIWFIGFELIYDDNNLIISDISSDDFESYVYKENNKKYVISEAIENSNSNNICSNGILYCGNYEVSIKFYIKNTNLTEATIKMENIEISLLDMSDSEKTYTKDDIITIKGTLNKSHTIKINQATNETQEPPKDITTTSNPLDEIFSKTKRLKSTNTKSSNAFIKELEIDKYDIDFNKNKTNYIIRTSEDINELNIHIKLENENATYKIVGADDLKSNNNEVAIIVTAEDNNKLTYTIDVKYIDEIIKKDSEEKINLKEVINKYMTKDNLTYAGITLGIIIIIILIIILKNKKENKKINKLLGEL